MSNLEKDGFIAEEASMSNPLNITTAAFDGLREVTTAPLWQYDYGQILQITGLDLPQAFEVHFSNSRKSGETITQIGTDNQVTIPDMYLTSGADIYAFVFLHDGTDDGETEYVIKIPVRERPEPSDIEPTPEQQDAITEAIAALNVAVTQTGEDKEATAALAEAAAASSLIATQAAQSAQGSATSASASATTATDAAATATQKAGEAAQSASEAESARASARNYAASASDSAGDADTAKTAAQSAAQTATAKASEASTSATSASGSASAASALASAASGSATSAANSATAAATSASTASTKASEATTAAQIATTKAGEASTSASTATSAKDTAVSASQTATTKATEATTAAATATSAKTDAVAANTAAQSAKTAAQTAQQGAETARDAVQSSAAQITTNAEDITQLKEDLTVVSEKVSAIEEAEGLHKYGVSGIGQSASALTRIWDSVGMTAQVGTDGDNSNVVNNFDDVTPFNRRKCVGHWVLHDGRPQFVVEAYLGDEDYAEDGTKGDYVAVECPRAYYYNKDGILGVSAHHYPGWKPFDIFCHNHNEEETFEFAYLPAYSLAVKDGHGVSLPDLDNAQGGYKALFDVARTYNNADVKGFAMLEPWAVNFYEWALQTVEFAKQVPTDIMKGCLSLRSNDADTVVFLDATHVLCNNYYASRVTGQYIAITPSGTGQTSYTYQATHKVISVIRCDASGNESPNGAYQKLEVEDLGKEYLTYDTTGATTYALAARPYRTGACNGVSTPSGSPVSNTDGYHPCRYRYRENPWGNQYRTIGDLFNKRVAVGDDYKLEWYYLPDPSKIVTPSDNITLPGDDYVKLDVETSVANYANGWIKSRQYADEYPDLWIPGATTGGSDSTYYAVSASLVNSSAVRACRFGGTWYYGYVYLFASTNLGASSARYGGDLCFPQ